MSFSILDTLTSDACICICTSSDNYSAQEETIIYPNRLYFKICQQFCAGLFSLKAFLVVGLGGLMWSCVLEQTQ